jgi:hypothetical protein
MEIYSFFYTKPIIREYYDKIKDAIPNKVLFSQDNIIDYFVSNNEMKKEQAIQYLHQSLLRSDICQGTIGPEYISRVFDKVFSSNFAIRSECDICFILNGELKPNATIEEKFTQIVGFCIVKRGDCAKYGKVYTLNLVCSKRGENVGSYFVGLYLYTILCHPLDASEILIAPKITKLTETDDPDTYYGIPLPYIGLLELSGGYKNVPGLCLYSKFGFNIDTSLSGRGSNCFVDLNNLAMKNDFIGDSSISVEERKTKIVSIVKREDPGFEKHLICNIKDKAKQNEMIATFYIIKDKTSELNALKSQAKFAINKMADGTLKSEFKEKMENKEKELIDLDEIIKNIARLSIGGASVSGRKKRKTRRKNVKKRTKTKKMYKRRC